jgi:hypothetical protein
MTVQERMEAEAQRLRGLRPPPQAPGGEFTHDLLLEAVKEMQAVYLMLGELATALRAATEDKPNDPS